METIELVAAKRTVKGKGVKLLRDRGIVPAVVYGKGQESKAIEINDREMARVYAQAGGSKIISLKVGSGKAQNVLIHDVQAGALRGELRHVDFYAVRMNEELTAEIPLHFVGESNAVYQENGTLVKVQESVEVKCLPADLPESIEVDISVLDDFEKTITLAGLKLPQGVSLTTEDTTLLVVKVDPPRTEAEMAELEEEVGEAAPVETEETEAAETKSES